MKVCLQYGHVRLWLWASVAFVLFAARKISRGKLTKETATALRRALKTVKRPYRLVRLETKRLKLVITL